MVSQVTRKYYLILSINGDGERYFIKNCEAKDKDSAALYFKEELEKIGGKDRYTLQELLLHIKSEDELSEREKSLIQQERIM
jgi:hypothetical protein